MTGRDYALKMVDKHLIVRHKMVDHIKQERNILVRACLSQSHLAQVAVLPQSKSASSKRGIRRRSVEVKQVEKPFMSGLRQLVTAAADW